MTNILTAKQIRNARLLARITQEQLAMEARVPLHILKNIETGRISLNRVYAAAIRIALEGYGVKFMSGDQVQFKPAHVGMSPYSWD